LRKYFYSDGQRVYCADVEVFLLWVCLHNIELTGEFLLIAQKDI